jgi:hypothetical protein
MPAQPTPPNPIGLQNTFDQFVEAFNKGQFSSESKPGLNDLVSPTFTPIDTRPMAWRISTKYCRSHKFAS